MFGFVKDEWTLNIINFMKNRLQKISSTHLNLHAKSPTNNFYYVKLPYEQANA
jgi:hypothetical protein